MQTTIKNPIDGMIEICARRKKKIGGKDYLIYFETIAGQVKLYDGRSVQELADTVDDYFREARIYIATLAEAAKDSEDNAKASEIAAKASEVAAAASQAAARASELAAAASQAASLASERAAKVSEDNAKASELAAAASYRNAHQAELNAQDSERRSKASEEAAAASALEAENLSVGVLTPHAVERTIQRSTEQVLEYWGQLKPRFEEFAAEYERKYGDFALIFAKAQAATSFVLDKHTLKLDESRSRIDAVEETARQELQTESVRLDDRIDNVHDRISDIVAEAILRFVREQAVQASINSKLQVIGAEFTQHQIYDAERFSDLSLASVIHTRKLLEAKEERSEFVYRSAISDIKLAHTLMLQQVYAAQFYMDNRQRAYGLYGFRDTNNNVTGNQQFGFVPDDGSSATQGPQIDLTVP